MSAPNRSARRKPSLRSIQLSDYYGSLGIEGVRAIAESLIDTLRAHDSYTASHCERVGQATRQLALAVGLQREEATVAEYAGLFHDLGKAGLPEKILNKPSLLNPDEESKMRSHAAWSESLIRPLAIFPFFAKTLPGIRSHHERWDGTGYPDRLRGEDIPLIARVVAIVDTVDAMTSDRAYRKGLPLVVAYQEVFRCSGTQFDPRLAQIYLKECARFEPDLKAAQNISTKKVA